MEETKDCNGNLLIAGDSVQLNKDLKLKGSSTTYKIGTVFKNIRLTSGPEEIECRDGKTTLVLKTCFLKKRG
jgi:protein PhnA